METAAPSLLGKPRGCPSLRELRVKVQRAPRDYGLAPGGTQDEIWRLLGKGKGEEGTNRSVWKKEQSPRWRADGGSICIGKSGWDECQKDSCQ